MREDPLTFTHLTFLSSFHILKCLSKTFPKDTDTQQQWHIVLGYSLSLGQCYKIICIHSTHIYWVPTICQEHREASILEEQTIVNNIQNEEIHNTLEGNKN